MYTTLERGGGRGMRGGRNGEGWGIRELYGEGVVGG